MKLRMVTIVFGTLLFVGACSNPPIKEGHKSNAAKPGSKLYETIAKLDSRMFEDGFNQCKIEAFEELTDTDFEFYHDQAGITDGKSAFVATFRDGLCQMDYRAERELIPGTLQVFPLYNQGELYGAIQMADHAFYAHDQVGNRTLTSRASMTSLWRLNEGKWTYSRGLSYNHVVPDE